jgi:hypothetical protein
MELIERFHIVMSRTQKIGTRFQLWRSLDNSRNQVCVLRLKLAPKTGAHVREDVMKLGHALEEFSVTASTPSIGFVALLFALPLGFADNAAAQVPPSPSHEANRYS